MIIHLYFTFKGGLKIKRNKIILTLVMLFVVLCVVSTVNATDNVTDDVVNVNDETDFVQANNDDQSVSEEPLTTNEEEVISASPGTFADLTNEIKNATGELNLSRDYVFSSSDTRGINIDKEITINGNGFSINAKSKQSVVVGISSNNVVLKNIVFVNFASYYIGGAMSWSGNNGTLINCSFENCKIDSLNQYESSNRGGGAIYWTGNDGTLINCSFKNCKVSVASKMIYTYALGGAIYWTGNNCKLINSSFVNCACSQNFGHTYGGAIYFKYWPSDVDDGGRVDIINCIFEDNLAQTGGAIYSELAYNKIDKSTFNSNNAKIYGGALYLKGNGFDIVSSEGEYLEYRSIMSTADINNCIFRGNVAKNGGAIYEANNGTIIYSSKFINNSATNESGAIYVINDYDLLSDCIFIDNKATNNGAAILWKGNDGSILSSIFVNNSAAKDSGIYMAGANNIVKDSVLFSNNQNPIIFAANYVVTANYNWWGNTIHNYNQQPTVPARVNVKNWLFMNFTVNTTSLKVGEIAAVNCDLTNLITSNGIISKYNAIDLPILNLTVVSDNNIDTSISMISGLCEAKYVATHTPTGYLTIRYNTIEETFYFTIQKAELQLNVSDSLILKGNLLVSAPNNADGIVHVVINNKDYSANMTNGRASVAINDLPLGRYLATTSFESDSYNVNVFNSYIDIKSSIDANNLTKNQDSADKFQATFYNFDGNVLKNIKVTFMLNGGLQTATTDNNGVASLDINLSPNTYEITSLNPVTDETKLNKIIIIGSGGSSTDNNNTPSGNTDNNNTPTGNNSGENSNQTNNDPKPINDNQITIPSLSTGSGTVKLPTDASGTITLDIAGKKYNFPVVNGVANVKLPDLANGNYGYIITYSGDTNYASFTKTGSVTVKKQTIPTKPVVKTTITLKTVKVKKSAKKLILQATLKQGKKALSGKKVTFKFNGKTYKAKTNKKGIAKVTIKKNVLKKLKVGKKVTYQAGYGKVTAKKTAKIKK